jgi:glycine hydroxymethyltransferase
MEDPIMNPIRQTDPTIASLLRCEDARQRDTFCLIASENHASAAVRECMASRLGNRYSEGYPGKRFYEGQAVVDQIEEIAIARAKTLFGAEHANVQPYSGSPANLAVYAALLQPGDTVLAMDLAAGGHLTHGSSASITGKWFKALHYAPDSVSGQVDPVELERLALECRPKLVIAGFSAWPRQLDWSLFRKVADMVGAKLMVDMAHFAGLVAGGAVASPVPFADVVTSTTHKTLRGPRGGLILSRQELASKLDRAVFPATQGGPHDNATAAKAICFLEAATPDFALYARSVTENARALAKALSQRGIPLVTGGTDNHLMMLDLTATGFHGKELAQALDKAGIVCNANKIPNDPRPASTPSGIRLGTPAVTTRGLAPVHMERLAGWITAVVEKPDDGQLLSRVRREVRDLARQFPVP